MKFNICGELSSLKLHLFSLITFKFVFFFKEIPNKFAACSSIEFPLKSKYFKFGFVDKKLPIEIIFSCCKLYYKINLML